jgi:hypothetical protein
VRDPRIVAAGVILLWAGLTELLYSTSRGFIDRGVARWDCATQTSTDYDACLMRHLSRPGFNALEWLGDAVWVAIVAALAGAVVWLISGRTARFGRRGWHYDNARHQALLQEDSMFSADAHPLPPGDLPDDLPDDPYGELRDFLRDDPPPRRPPTW